jgi:hypothetical protein
MSFSANSNLFDVVQITGASVALDLRYLTRVNLTSSLFSLVECK